MANSGDGEAERPNKRTKYDYFLEVTVLVGAQEDKFLVHRNIVCKTSEFFRAACNVQWKEGREKAVRLPEADREAFGAYLGWLYTREVDVGKRDETCTVSVGDAWVSNVDRLVNAYSLGQILLDTSFSNGVVDATLTFIDTHHPLLLPPADLIENLLRKVPVCSKMVQLWVDFVATHYNHNIFREYSHGLPAPFLLEMANASVEQRFLGYREKQPRNRPKCFYHEHRDESDKCS